MRLETKKLSEITPYPNNPRINDNAVDAVAESIRQCGYVAPIIVDEAGVILAGHTRYKALKKLRKRTAEVVVREGLTEEQKRKYRILDNKVGELAGWDEDLLRIELQDLDFDDFDFGLDLPPTDTVEVSSYERARPGTAAPETSEDIARMMDELDEDDPEYQAFVEKFAPKRTTDDCATPGPVYDAVATYVAAAYGVKPSRFVRPFFPGGDYQHFAYGPEAVVVDNPPFSILSEILRWYSENGVRFFLFAPALTLFGALPAGVTALPCGVTVTYDNGATVSTSFLTNLEDPRFRVRVKPDLYQAVADGNDENLRVTRKVVPKYAYPDNILTAMMAARWARYGVSYDLLAAESMLVRELDEQKAAGKAIYGGGYLLGTRAAAERAAAERAAAERAAAERAAAERAAAERWALSDRENDLVRRLDEAVDHAGL